MIPLESKSKSENKPELQFLRRENGGQFKAPGQDGWIGLFEGDGGEAELFELLPLHSLSEPLQQLADLSWL